MKSTAIYKCGNKMEKKVQCYKRVIYTFVTIYIFLCMCLNQISSYFCFFFLCLYGIPFVTYLEYEKKIGALLG